MDIEAWEANASLVTEIGLAVAEGGALRHRHLLIADNLARRNGRYVADERDNFVFGDSEVADMATAAAQAAAPP